MCLIDFIVANWEILTDCAVFSSFSGNMYTNKRVVQFEYTLGIQSYYHNKKAKNIFLLHYECIYAV